MSKGLNVKKIAIIIGVIAVAVGIGFGITALFGVNAFEGTTMPAYNRKDTSQALGTEANPYTILEIVPDLDSATVGYLIKGQEPNDGGLDAISATNKAVQGSAANVYANAFGNPISSTPASIVSDYDMTYAFLYDIDPKKYKEDQKLEDNYEGMYPDTPVSEIHAYSQFGYFEKVAVGQGSYSFINDAFTPAVDNNGNPTGNYVWHNMGEFIYDPTYSRTDAQIRCTREMYYDTTVEDMQTHEQIEIQLPRTYSTEAVGDQAFNYYYAPYGDFVWVPGDAYDGTFIFNENCTVDQVNNAKVGDKLYMTRTEQVYCWYYSTQIICNDLLRKALVGDQASFNYVTQVVTVTPEMLNNQWDKTTGGFKPANEIIEKADMIIVHDCATGYDIARAIKQEGKSYTAPKFTQDISDKVMKYLVYRGSSATPAAIVFDEDAIKNATDCPQLQLLYEVYNNLGAKLAYNWLQGNSSDYDKQDYSKKLTEAKKSKDAYGKEQYYRNFNKMKDGDITKYEYEPDALGRSQYVYNVVGTDDKWLTTTFGGPTKNEAGISNNDDILRSNLNAPAFDDVGLTEDSSRMSVATMLKAINLEANGINQPRHLRILELQPNEKFYGVDDNGNKLVKKDEIIKYYLDLMPWFIGNDHILNITDDKASDDTLKNADFIISDMPTWEFIGRNEDPNETYDLILVGNKKQDETNGMYGYNDALPTVMSYTAVGDLITTFGGDEEADKNIEDNEDYRWHYGLFKDNKWSWTQNAYISKDGGWSKYSNDYANFKKHFVYQYYDYKDGTNVFSDGMFGPWWYEYDRGNGFAVYATKHGSDANMIGLRYSGNDLTKKKYDQLLDYASQAPVIVSDDLYYGVEGVRDLVNPYVVDKSSFVYQLAGLSGQASIVHKYINGVDVNNKANKVKSDIIADNISATFIEKPVEYDADAAVNNNQQTDADGNNVLQYRFTVNGNDASTYGVNLYTDSNGNGIFEGCINFLKERDANGDNSKYDSEKSVNLSIVDETDRVFVTDGILKNGHTYLVTKVLPTSDIGLIPWKLELYKQGNDSVRFSEEGNTRIKVINEKDKTTIHVLQMNLNANMSNDQKDTRVNFADTSSDVGKKFAQYIEGLEDFDIDIKFMSNSEWSNKYKVDGGRENWAKDLMQYDMLVIGFTDSAKFTNDEDFIYGFEEFRKAGKSIILSHDLVQDATFGITSKNYNYDTNSVIQTDVRYYLRDISGQIRKYYDAESGSNDYSYMDYHSYGRSLSFKPSDNFKIYTSIKQTFKVGLIKYHPMTLEVRNYDDNPVYDKYTYTYGNFDESNNWERLGFLWHPDYGFALTKPNKEVRKYYETHDYKPANLIMDNSIRAMLYYNYIYYVEDKKYGPDYGFLDNIDRLVRNIDLNNLSQRRTLVWGDKAFATNRVEKANDGQITKYPFAIPDSLFVADTHAQNYQLDLEYDNDGDVLVWYNLAGTGTRSDGGKSDVNRNSVSVYDGRNQDSRNNYYIYTKGNITYTGLGHSKAANSPMTDDEIKLFINTMVAAYRSAAADPYVRVTNPGSTSTADGSIVYVDDIGDSTATGNDTTDVTFRIYDDTTNAKIKNTKHYDIEVYAVDDANNEVSRVNHIYVTGGGEASSYDIDHEYLFKADMSALRAGNSLKYKIKLTSYYIDEYQNQVDSKPDEHYVTLTYVPLFDLR